MTATEAYRLLEAQDNYLSELLAKAQKLQDERDALLLQIHAQRKAVAASRAAFNEACRREGPIVGGRHA